MEGKGRKVRFNKPLAHRRLTEPSERLLSKMNTYNSETQHGFEASLAWLREWACARSYGLGSKLPWDPQFLVESLTDSTIYMSYYTVSHLLHSLVIYHCRSLNTDLRIGSVDGQTVGPLGITADQMTDEVWDCVLSGYAYPKSSEISRENIDRLKAEFNFWYPMDVRSSGKDLIPNHLSFCIYVHAALFGEDKWPLSMRANGHLLLNGKKMYARAFHTVGVIANVERHRAKSTGNSLTLANSVEKFGADATRLALADAGDATEDANFEEYTANASILRMFTLIEWAEVSAKRISSLVIADEDAGNDCSEEQDAIRSTIDILRQSLPE